MRVAAFSAFALAFVLSQSAHAQHAPPALAPTETGPGPAGLRPPVPVTAQPVLAEAAPAPVRPVPTLAPTEDDKAKAKAKAKAEMLPCLTSKESCSVEDLKTPTSPAFAIIGTAPSQIEMPRTPRQLALALYNAYKGGAISQDIALDVAPYWLFSHPELSYDEYVMGASPLQLLQNLSISVATVAVSEPAAADLGVGLRTHLFFPDASNYEPQSTLRKNEGVLLLLQEEKLLKPQRSPQRSGEVRDVTRELRVRSGSQSERARNPS